MQRTIPVLTYRPDYLNKEVVVVEDSILSKGIMKTNCNELGSTKCKQAFHVEAARVIDIELSKMEHTRRQGPRGIRGNGVLSEGQKDCYLKTLNIRKL